MRKFDKRADPFYNTKAWRAVRNQAMIRDHYMCVRCIAEHEQCDRVRPQPATMVHHKIPRAQRPDLALVLDNLESLCDDHHAKAHPEKGERAGNGKRLENKPVGMQIVKI